MKKFLVKSKATEYQFCGLLKFYKMKQITILTIAICIFSNSIFSQKKMPITNKIIYGFSHIKDTNRPDIISDEDMILHITSDESKYQSYTLQIMDSINDENYKRSGKLFVSNGTREQIFTDFNNRIQYSVFPWLNDTLLIKNNLDSINWIIKDSSKNISGFECLKAEGFCKGRFYEVWFCPEIPIAAGPWKLSGLPGLILEAYDLRRSIIFTFKSITNIEVPEYINLPNKFSQVTTNEFIKMKESLLSNPSGYINSVINANSFSNGINSASKIDIKNSSSGNIIRKKINNPLEL